MPAAAAKSLQSCPTLRPHRRQPTRLPSLEFPRQAYWSGLPFPSPVHESEKWKQSHSVVSNSSWPHGLQPTRLLCPWDFPGKSTGVGCHCLIICLLLLLLSRFSRVRLCDPTDGSPPGSAVPGILQGKTLEWVAISFSNVWNWKVKVKLLSCVRLFVTPWTVAYQAPPSMGFSRQEYWSGLPLPSPNKAQRRFNFLVNIWKPTLEKESSYIW